MCACVCVCSWSKNAFVNMLLKHLALFKWINYFCITFAFRLFGFCCALLWVELSPPIQIRMQSVRHMFAFVWICMYVYMHAGTHTYSLYIAYMQFRLLVYFLDFLKHSRFEGREENVKKSERYVASGRDISIYTLPPVPNFPLLLLFSITFKV